MNNLVLKNSIRFFFLLLLQVTILNNVNFLGYLNPMVYVLWVLLFPIRKNKTYILITSFLLGLCIDFFSDSGGINAFSLTFIAFIRLNVLKFILKKTDFDYITFTIKKISFSKTISYFAILIVIHHILIYMLTYFSFNHYLVIITKTLTSSLFTLFLSILGILLVKKGK